MVTSSVRFQISNDPFPQFPDAFDHGRITAPLGSHLHFLPVAFTLRPSCRLHKNCSCRVFDIDMLARLAGQNRCRGMPEIRRGNGNRVDLGIVEDPPEISHQLRGFLLLPFQRLGARGQAVLIDIAKVGDFAVGNIEVPLDVPAATAQAHHSDPETLIGALGLAQQEIRNRGGGQRGGGNGSSFHKRTAGNTHAATLPETRSRRQPGCPRKRVTCPAIIHRPEEAPAGKNLPPAPRRPREARNPMTTESPRRNRCTADPPAAG